MSTGRDWWCARFVALWLLLLSGCMAPWSTRREADPLARSVGSSDSLPAMPIAAELPAQLASSVAKPTTPPVILTTEQEIALNNLVAEVRGSRTLDPAAEHQLRTQLRQAPQDEWPLVVKHFRSTLAYREQLLARETQQASEIRSATHTTAFPPLPQHVESNTVNIEKNNDSAAPIHAVQQASHVTPIEPLPVRGTTVANLSTGEPVSANGVIAPVSHKTVPDPDWRSQLASAIESMQQEVKTNPGSTDELQEHMRLRMLMLMAGLEDDSLSPIPGASPTEQDYWSKQLFALSTYFDTSRQPDMKQRAAGSLVHLDAARAKLAELATLQVRNLTFVDSVDGYGLYEIHQDAKFKAGDQVALYAEVDNFRSESTKEGYRTILGTSYEVVDTEGRRVDGAQFLDVEDICRNQRRDFHMRYGVALPTRIYPGTYELRLIITDQLSNKIAQATVPFEIVE